MTLPYAGMIRIRFDGFISASRRPERAQTLQPWETMRQPSEANVWGESARRGVSKRPPEETASDVVTRTKGTEVTESGVRE